MRMRKSNPSRNLPRSSFWKCWTCCIRACARCFMIRSAVISLEFSLISWPAGIRHFWFVARRPRNTTNASTSASLKRRKPYVACLELALVLANDAQSFSNFIRKPTQAVPASFTERLGLLCSEVLDIVKEEGPLLVAKDSTASPVLQVRFTPCTCLTLILIR